MMPILECWRKCLAGLLVVSLVMGTPLVLMAAPSDSAAAGWQIAAGRSKKAPSRRGKAAKPASDSTEQLLMDDDRDLLGEAPAEDPEPVDAPTPEPLPDPEADEALRTVLLDIGVVDAEDGDAQRAYRAVLKTLASAEDLGEVVGRDVLGFGGMYRHVVNSCRGMENTPCLANFAKSVEARYAVFGQLRDLDDVFLLELALMDVRRGRMLETAKAQIAKPGTTLAKQAAEAACRLTRNYGCSKDAMGAVAVAPVAAPVTLQTNTPQGMAKPQESYFSTQSETPEKAMQVERSGGPSSMAIGGWVMVGLAAGAAVGGAVTTALMFKEYDTYDNAQPGEGQKARDAKDAAQLYQWTSLGLYIGAGALAAGGITLLVLDAMAPADGSGGGDWQIVPSMSPSGPGMNVMGRF